MVYKKKKKSSQSFLSILGLGLLADKMHYSIIPLGFCIFLAALSAVQTFYFRDNVRRMMLEGSRRIKYKISSEKTDWLLGAQKIFDKNPQTATAVPFQKGGGPKKAELLVELALTHFPFSKDSTVPAERKPAFIEIYNGPCSQCPLDEFQKKPRMKEVVIKMIVRELDLPIVHIIQSKETEIWEKKILFPDRPGPQRLDLSRLSFFPNRGSSAAKTGVVLLKINVLSVYPSRNSETGDTVFEDAAVGNAVFGDAVFLERIRYIDKDSQGNLHYWE